MVRRFNDNDWQGWCGAERFDDGTDPFIYEDDKVCIIGDKTGVCISFDADDCDGPEIWALNDEDSDATPAERQHAMKALIALHALGQLNPAMLRGLNFEEC